MNNDSLIKKTDVEKIAREGTRIYEKIKSNYDPKEKGKFLAIEIESQKAYLGTASADAVNTARQSHPNKIFYVVKIGFDTAETIAHSFLDKKR